MFISNIMDYGVW